MTTYGDTTLGLSAQSLAILAILADESFSTEDDEDADDEAVMIESRAWYNGRENGVSLMVRILAADHAGAGRKAMILTFGQSRLSDEIFVDRWLTDVTYRPPADTDLNPAKPAKRQMFGRERIDLACRYIRDEIETYVLAEREAVDRLRARAAR